MGSLEESKEEETKEDSKNVDELDFLEIDIRKKVIDNIANNSKKETAAMLKPFSKSIGEPPIFKHKVFNAWMQPEQVQMEDVEMMNMEAKKGPGIFLSNKLKEQQEQAKLRKKELRQQRREGIKIPKKAPVSKKFAKMDPKDVENCEALEIVLTIS